MGCFSSKEQVYSVARSAPTSKGGAKEVKEEDRTGGLSQVYDVQHLLGSGAAGDTWLCKDNCTGELLAVKLMKRPILAAMTPGIMREVKIGAYLGRGHINIVKPREVILTRTHLGLVMEYVAGGNMADHILKTILLKFGSFDYRDGLVMEEDEARYYFIQIIHAVDFCHRNKVAHRDLKMDNTLLDDSSPPRIKLCDFGFANWWNEEPNMSTIMGTPDYMSPQLLGPKAHNQAASYDGTKADIWAAGVMLCVMLIGRFPFEGTDMATATNLDDISMHVWRQMNSQQWFANPLIAHDATLLSPDCVDLLNRIFELDEAKRITITEIMHHQWFVQPLPSHFQEAIDHMLEEQRRIHLQVASGAFVNKERDRTLKEIVFLAATRWEPAQEELMDGGTLRQGPRPPSLRRVSLNAIKPYEYETKHTDLATISEFFRQHALTSEGSYGAHHAAQAALAALEREDQQRLLRRQQEQQQQHRTHQRLGGDNGPAPLNGNSGHGVHSSSSGGSSDHAQAGAPSPQHQQQQDDPQHHISSLQSTQQLLAAGHSADAQAAAAGASPVAAEAAAASSPQAAAQQQQQQDPHSHVNGRSPPRDGELSPVQEEEDQAARVESWKTWQTQAATGAAPTTTTGNNHPPHAPVTLPSMCVGPRAGC